MDVTPKNATLPRMVVTFRERTHSSNYGTTSRPLSYYDNISRENRQVIDHYHLHQDGCQCQELHAHQLRHERSPTQVPLLSTTVPQKIGTESIGSRHEPTRNSLRHSRMIVMGKNGNEIIGSPPRIVQSHKLAKVLVGLQTLLGAVLLTLSLWLILWAPNIRTRDNAYWSAIPLFGSGITGLILLCCCSRGCIEVTEELLVSGFKLFSIFISAAAGIGCFTATTFAAIHIISLATMDCSPIDQLNASCYCKVPSFSNSTLPIRNYLYTDLNCLEVHHILIILIVFSCTINFIGGVVSLWYVYVHWVSRYNSYQYSRVRSKDKQTST